MYFCPMKYVNMHHDYIKIRLTYVNMQHNYVDMQLNYLNIKKIMLNGT